MKQLNNLVKELFELVDKVECSDNGRHFFPTQLEFSSCRVMDGQRIGNLIVEIKRLVGVPPRMSEEELHLLNNPDDYNEIVNG